VELAGERLSPAQPFFSMMARPSTPMSAALFDFAEAEGMTISERRPNTSMQ